MRLLIGNYFLFFNILSGCTTPSSYRIFDKGEFRTEILVTPDRILLQCEDLEDRTETPVSNPGGYGFMIHILDKENTVLTVAQGNIIDKKSCFDRIEKIEAMKKKSKLIYLGCSGTLDSEQKETSFSHNFPGKGIFKTNDQSLQFILIKGDNGACYSAYQGETCESGAEFPIHKMPF